MRVDVTWTPSGVVAHTHGRSDGADQPVALPLLQHDRDLIEQVLLDAVDRRRRQSIPRQPTTDEEAR